MQAGPFRPYPSPGEVLDGKYRVESIVGEGGMGAVAKATHLLRRAPVALKFMSAALLSLPGAVERFVNEGVAASQIDSDHVVRIFDVCRLPSGAPFLVMEFLDGRDLGQVLAIEGPRLPVARALYFTLQILRALQTAHAAGIIHRDMKPSNCFVIEKDGDPDFVKLVDFGISKVRSADEAPAPALTRTNSALGTPLYMSPEQARSPRDVDARTDLYSVGAILYEMLCGRTPYTSESGEFTEILFKIFTTEPEPIRSRVPDVPEGLAEAVHRALQRDREARYASAAEMAEALAPFADARSHDIAARIRAARGRSLLPPGSRSVPPASAVSPPPPVAAVDARSEAPAEGGRAPRVPTHVGVTRESGSPPATSRTTLAIAGSIALVLAAATAVAVSRGGHVPASSSGSEGPAASSPPPAPVPEPPSAPLTTLAPSASAAPPEEPAPHASSSANGSELAPRPVTHVVPIATAPSATASSTAAPPALPKQLGDLKLH
jgi:serine/threonine-protein kinase